MPKTVFITEPHRRAKRSRFNRLRPYNRNNRIQRSIKSRRTPSLSYIQRIRTNFKNNLPSKDSNVSYPLSTPIRKLRSGYDQNGGYFPSFERNSNLYSKSICPYNIDTSFNGITQADIIYSYTYPASISHFHFSINIVTFSNMDDISVSIRDITQKQQDDLNTLEEDQNVISDSPINMFSTTNINSVNNVNQLKLKRQRLDDENDEYNQKRRKYNSVPTVNIEKETKTNSNIITNLRSQISNTSRLIQSIPKNQCKSVIYKIIFVYLPRGHEPSIDNFNITNGSVVYNKNDDVICTITSVVTCKPSLIPGQEIYEVRHEEVTSSKVFNVAFGDRVGMFTYTGVNNTANIVGTVSITEIRKITKNNVV